jgi:hypothetical protein
MIEVRHDPVKSLSSPAEVIGSLVRPSHAGRPPKAESDGSVRSDPAAGPRNFFSGRT